MAPFRRLGWLFVLCAAAVALGLCSAGCATSDPDAESDLPWNMSQPWESSPGIPGLNNGY